MLTSSAPLSRPSIKVGSRLIFEVASQYGMTFQCVSDYIINAIEGDGKGNTPGEIKIRFQKGILIIYDDGPGMSRSELEYHLHHLFSSRKDPEKTVGRFGFGLYAGISISKKVVILTKKKYDCNVTEAKITKCQELINEAKDSEKEIDVLGNHIEVETKDMPELKEKHFTQVTLFLTDEAYEELKEELERFLKRALPVDFDPKFKWGEKIRKRLQEWGIEIGKIKVYFNGKEVFKEPSGDILPDYSPPIFIEIKDNQGKIIARSWICIHKQSLKGRGKEELGPWGIGLYWPVYEGKYPYAIEDPVYIERSMIMWWKNKPHLRRWVIGEIYLLKPLRTTPGKQLVHSREVYKTYDLLEEQIVKNCVSHAAEMASAIRNLENERTKKIIEKLKKHINDAEEELKKEEIDIDKLEMIKDEINKLLERPITGRSGTLINQVQRYEKHKSALLKNVSWDVPEEWKNLVGEVKESVNSANGIVEKIEEILAEHEKKESKEKVEVKEKVAKTKVRKEEAIKAKEEKKPKVKEEEIQKIKEEKLAKETKVKKVSIKDVLKEKLNKLTKEKILETLDALLSEELKEKIAQKLLEDP